MSAVLDFQQTLKTETCPSCFMVFAMPSFFQETRRRDKTSFYCPAGHAQSYMGKTYEQGMKEARALAENLRQQLDQAQSETWAAQQKVVKLRKRVRSGVCPEPGCKRTFENLARHVKTVHNQNKNKKVEAAK